MRGDIVLIEEGASSGRIRRTEQSRARKRDKVRESIKER